MEAWELVLTVSANCNPRSPQIRGLHLRKHLRQVDGFEKAQGLARLPHVDTRPHVTGADKKVRSQTRLI
jgi:hypothetical protein